MGDNWTRAQRKRHKDEVQAGIEPPRMRPIFITTKMIAKQKARAALVAKRLLGK